ncbi:MAG TPA: helix-turn-helix domain-containing protein [Solirubrobacteraceae bacterium]|nr:helix-turn-helix domain-containing protein [Solirubrobacteraceae bacterium]
MPASRQAVAEVRSLAPGTWDPAEDPSVSRTPYGFLVVEGALVRRIAVGSRHSAELLGEGDFLRPQTPDSDEYAIVTQRASWQVLDEVHLALLSEDLIGALAVLPGVLPELAARAVQRSRSLALRLAIAQLPNLEQRLHLLLWHLADRWGRQERGAVVLSLRLTQGLLAELVRAQRTSVNAALKHLVAQGTIERRGTAHWALPGDPPGHLLSQHPTGT